MTRGRWPRPRLVALAAAAAGAVVVGHLLDALALLPGVHEDAAVRAAALAPTYDVLTVCGAALLAVGVERLLRHGLAGLGAAALLAGQVGLLGLPELLGRQESGQGEQWGALPMAVGLQVLLAAATTTVVLLVDAVVVRALAPAGGLLLPADVAVPRVALSRRRGRTPYPLRTRGPPVPVIH